jgi:hypothetical protein
LGQPFGQQFIIQNRCGGARGVSRHGHLG